MNDILCLRQEHPHAPAQGLVARALSHKPRTDEERPAIQNISIYLPKPGDVPFSILASDFMTGYSGSSEDC